MISPMRSDKYWAARAARRMDYTMKDAQEISNRIGRAYNGALRDIQSQLDGIFRNFSAGISRAEAVRILNRVSIGRSSSVTDMLKQALDLVSDPEDRAKLLAEINAPAYKYRMQRLKELAEDAGKKCAEIARTTRSELDGGLAGIVRDSYFRGIFDMQQGTGLAFSFSKISDRQVREILSQDWSGAHYSKRIWQNTNALAGELQNTLLKGVLTGASSGRMANEIQQRFHASYSRALTLTRTESSHCANSAELRRYEETGVKKYRYVATLDSHTSDVCQELDGQEFPVEDASPGENYPPMHPRCRSTTIAAISPALMQKLERRARDPETGKLRTVPADMTYREWYGKYVEGGESFKAKNLSIFNDNNAPSTEHIDAEQVYDNMQSSIIGREYLEYAENLPEPIVFDYDSYIPGVRGENIGNRIVIYMKNEDNNSPLKVARTVIHELTHYRYGIGGSQWSECVCIAHELMHKYNRKTLTFSEKKRIIEAVKRDSDYGKLNWRKGGIIHGRRKSH